MIWHVLVRNGKTDNYNPALGSEPRINVGFQRPDDAWLVGNNVFSIIQKQTGLSTNGKVTDLLNLAMSVFAADLRIPRKYSKDQWSREIKIHFPVVDLQNWSSNVSLLSRTLNFLTGDNWKFHLRNRDNHIDTVGKKKIGNIDSVCLFSGGLDSLVGAIDLLGEGKSVALVGHHGAGITNPIQERVLSSILPKHKGKIFPFMFYVQPPKNNSQEGEPSMRSRSFLFFAIGVAVGTVLGLNSPLVVAENGLISLNVPLTGARTGSRSTRTTHPYYVYQFCELMKGLGIPASIEMPYRFKTKGEMLKGCKDQTLLSLVAKLTMSCSHPEAGRFRGVSPNSHCGYCVPCIIRKASTKYSGIPDAIYTIPIETSPPSYKTNSGSDYRAFCIALERLKDLNLRNVKQKILSSGPLPPEDLPKYSKVFLNGMNEVSSLFRNS